MPRHTHHVLLVEDHNDTQRVVAQVLQDDGWTVTTADDGEEGLEALRTGLLPCVILVDWIMPRMGGLEFRTRQLQHPVWAEIPTILTSANAHRADELPVPFTRLIPKPVTMDRLLGAMADVCRGGAGLVHPRVG